MKIKLFILLIILSITVIAQDKSYLELRKEYKAFCNEIVIDTLIENGVVNYEIGDGLKLIPKDTVWDKVICPEYKSGDFFHRQIRSICDSISLHTYLSYNDYSYSKPSVQKFQTTITREKYCKEKRTVENENDFWEWVEINYLK